MKTLKKAESSSKTKNAPYRKLSDNINGFQKRWNVKWSNDEVFNQFKNRLLFLIDKYLSIYLIMHGSKINQYAYLCGLPAPYPAAGDDTMLSFELSSYGLPGTIIYSTIANTTDQIQLAWYLQNLFVVISEISQSDKTPQTTLFIFSFFLELEDLVNSSPAIQIKIARTGDSATVFPAGAKLLDEGLINDNISWMQEYPKSFAAFEQSLEIYLSGDKPKFRNLKDNLRVAVEQLLRKILNNSKSLENQSKELDEWLEKQGVHKQIRNIYGQLLFGNFAILQNEVAKHDDVELTLEEIEYLIYQTGTFMRLIIQLCRSEA